MEQAGLSGVEVARILGWSPGWVSRLLTGKRGCKDTEIAQFLGVSVGQARLRRFPDSEVAFQIDENIRGTDVFVVQPTCAPVDHLAIDLDIRREMMAPVKPTNGRSSEYPAKPSPLATNWPPRLGAVNVWGTLSLVNPCVEPENSAT